MKLACKRFATCLIQLNFLHLKKKKFRYCLKSHSFFKILFFKVYVDYGRTNNSQFEYQEINLILNTPNSPDKISSTRMRLQSSPALSLKFTFCFAFSEKESGFAQPTITFAAA